MPDINLLKDTERLDEAQKTPAPSARGFDLSAPEKVDKKGFTEVFRSLFKRKSIPVPTGKAAETMGLGKSRLGDRILTEKRQAAPSVIPLPDEESFNVNLLTEDLAGGFSARHKLIQLSLIAVGAVAVVGLVYAGLTLYERNVTGQVAATKEKLTGVKLQIDGLRDDQDRIIATTKKTSAIQSLINQHIRWTKFFNRLEHYITPEVTLGKIFSGDIQGSMTFTAHTDSYERVAAQYLILQQAVANHDFIQSFSITGATRTVAKDVPTVSFTIGLVLEPSLLENVPLPVTPASAAGTTTPQP